MRIIFTLLARCLQLHDFTTAAPVQSIPGHRTAGKQSCRVEIDVVEEFSDTNRHFLFDLLCNFISSMLFLTLHIIGSLFARRPSSRVVCPLQVGSALQAHLLGIAGLGIVVVIGRSVDV